MANLGSSIGRFAGASVAALANRAVSLTLHSLLFSPPCARRRRDPSVHLRCPRWLPSRHVRPILRCQRHRVRGRHPLPRSLVTAGHPVRCPNQAEEHLDHDGEQGYADGQPDIASDVQAGCCGVAQDLPELGTGLR